ncbi:unnamed protein product [Lupinus luteus]|uniref:DNA-directed RNA polymerase subunit n=1 Tax=Lupinus luteus TaxID=3873 RepID=A0AAV1YAE4_LUPLU
MHMELQNLFLDKVISNLGLCVSLYHIISIEGGYIFPSDGAPTYTVVFNLVMFRPFVGEVIAAKLLASNAHGLRLSVGFFDDIYVPAHLMPIPNHFEADPINSYENESKKGTWFWDYEGEHFAIEHSEDEIRFRVQSVSYPPVPVEQPKESKPFAPMLVTVWVLFHGGFEAEEEVVEEQA